MVLILRRWYQTKETPQCAGRHGVRLFADQDSAVIRTRRWAGLCSEQDYAGSRTWRWAGLVHCGGRGGSSREKVEDETLLTLPLKLKHILNCMSIHEVYCPVHIQIGPLQAKNIKLVSKREMNVVIVWSPPVTRWVTCCHRQGRSILSTHLH